MIKSHFFVFASLGLAQEARGLAGHGEAHVFRVDRSGANGPAFGAALVDFLGAGLGVSRALRGKNRLGERPLSFRYSPARWADCL